MLAWRSRCPWPEEREEFGGLKREEHEKSLFIYLNLFIFFWVKKLRMKRWRRRSRDWALTVECLKY